MSSRSSRRCSNARKCRVDENRFSSALLRHCERSEAIQSGLSRSGLLRCARNDGWNSGRVAMIYPTRRAIYLLLAGAPVALALGLIRPELWLVAPGWIGVQIGRAHV